MEKINLLSRSRGINRFKGLAKILVEINENYARVDGMDELVYWVQTQMSYQMKVSGRPMREPAVSA